MTKRDIKSVGIIGAGTMGGGIAMNFLNVGIPVTLLEMSQEALDRGVGVIRKNYENTAAKGKLTTEQVQERMGLMKPTLSYDDLRDADLIIEAVFETMAIKKEVFGKLDQVAKKGAILASNTSYLSIDEIADSTSRPSDVVGMHFFSPANVMRLLRNRARRKNGARRSGHRRSTSPSGSRKSAWSAAIATASSATACSADTAISASLMVLEGAMPEQVDAALRNFGMPMGLLQMSDLAGLDIGYKSRKDRDPATFDGRCVALRRFAGRNGTNRPKDPGRILRLCAWRPHAQALAGGGRHHRAGVEGIRHHAAAVYRRRNRRALLARADERGLRCA